MLRWWRLELLAAKGHSLPRAFFIKLTTHAVKVYEQHCYSPVLTRRTLHLDPEEYNNCTHPALDRSPQTPEGHQRRAQQPEFYPRQHAMVRACPSSVEGRASLGCSNAQVPSLKKRPGLREASALVECSAAREQ